MIERSQCRESPSLVSERTDAQFRQEHKVVATDKTHGSETAVIPLRLHHLRLRHLQLPSFEFLHLQLRHRQLHSQGQARSPARKFRLGESYSVLEESRNFLPSDKRFPVAK